MIKVIIKTVFIILFISMLSPAQQNSEQDTLSSLNETFKMQKSPWGAVARSVIIPGWGQFYNEDYWHIPVVWGFLGWFGSQWINNNDKYKIYRDKFKETEDPFDQTKRDFYRDQRDNFAIYFVITYLLNLVDAYVGAHLFDFSVEEDFILRSRRLNISYRF